MQGEGTADPFMGQLFRDGEIESDHLFGNMFRIHLTLRIIFLIIPGIISFQVLPLLLFPGGRSIQQLFCSWRRRKP